MDFLLIEKICSYLPWHKIIELDDEFQFSSVFWKQMHHYWFQWQSCEQNNNYKRKRSVPAYELNSLFRSLIPPAMNCKYPRNLERVVVEQRLIYYWNILFLQEKDQQFIRHDVIEMLNQFLFVVEAIEIEINQLHFSKQLFQKCIQICLSNKERNEKSIVRHLSKCPVFMKKIFERLPYRRNEHEISSWFPWVQSPLRDDIEFALDVISTSEFAFHHLAQNIQQNEMVQLKAFKLYPLQMVPKVNVNLVLQQHPDIIQSTLETEPLLLKYMPKTITSDFELTLRLVQRNANALEFVEKSLLANETLAKQYLEVGLQQNGKILKYIPKASPLRSDKRIILLAMSSNDFKYKAFKFADASLRSDKEFIIDLISKFRDMEIIHYASKSLVENDFDILLSATQRIAGFDALKYPLARQSAPIMSAFIERNCNRFYALPTEMKDNEQVVSAAVRQHGCVIKYASERLRNNRMVAGLAIENNIAAFYCLSEELKADDGIRIHRKQCRRVQQARQ